MDTALTVSLKFSMVPIQANENSNGDGPSDSATAGGDAEVTNVDDGDELYIDELNELEASFSKMLSTNLSNVPASFGPNNQNVRRVNHKLHHPVHGVLHCIKP
ncbi:hypothetical protein ACFX2I_032426 [Malus domestica]